MVNSVWLNISYLLLMFLEESSMTNEPVLNATTILKIMSGMTKVQEVTQ